MENGCMYSNFQFQGNFLANGQNKRHNAVNKRGNSLGDRRHEVIQFQVKSKQTGRSKQTAELNKNSKFSFQTSLLWSLSALEASKWLSKQSAESKQTAELTKNSKFSF